MYSDLGHNTYPKEMISIFSNNNIIEINDFKSIKVYGKENYSKRLRYIDKGHHNQYEAFAKNIIDRDNKGLPTLRDYYFASVMPLKAIESMKTNKVIEI